MADAPVLSPPVESAPLPTPEDVYHAILEGNVPAEWQEQPQNPATQPAGTTAQPAPVATPVPSHAPNETAAGADGLVEIKIGDNYDQPIYVRADQAEKLQSEWRRMNESRKGAQRELNNARMQAAMQQTAPPPAAPVTTAPTQTAPPTNLADIQQELDKAEALTREGRIDEAQVITLAANKKLLEHTANSEKQRQQETQSAQQREQQVLAQRQMVQFVQGELGGIQHYLAEKNLPADESKIGQIYEYVNQQRAYAVNVLKLPRELVIGPSPIPGEKSWSEQWLDRGIQEFFPQSQEPSNVPSPAPGPTPATGSMPTGVSPSRIVPQPLNGNGTAPQGYRASAYDRAAADSPAFGGRTPKPGSIDNLAYRHKP